MDRRDKVNAVRELAVNAGRNISMNPERYGEALLNDLEIGLGDFLVKIPDDFKDEYEDKYIAKYKEWLYAQSRCFSQLVTGAGGWNAATIRRHEKTNAAEQAALKRLLDWRERVIKRLNRQERLTGWAEVERLQAKLDDLEAMQERMKAANKVIRSKKLAEIEKVDELCALGFKEEQALQLLDPTLGWWGAGFAPFELTNNGAAIRDTKAKIERHAKMAQLKDFDKEYPWGVLRVSYSDERYRFVFDGKPEQDVINLLKEYSFKWSPKNQTWQRQITSRSTSVVKRIIIPTLNAIWERNQKGAV